MSQDQARSNHLDAGMAHWKGAAARARALKEQLLAVLRELEADADVSHAAGALTESAHGRLTGLPEVARRSGTSLASATSSRS